MSDRATGGGGRHPPAGQPKGWQTGMLM